MRIIIEQANDSIGKISRADIYKETMSTIRHISKIRYILFPFYFTAMAVITSQIFNKCNIHIPQDFLAISGFLLSLLFLQIERYISIDLKLLWEEVSNMITSDKIFEGSVPKINPLKHREDKTKLEIIRWLFLFPYVTGIAISIYFFILKIPCNLTYYG